MNKVLISRRFLAFALINLAFCGFSVFASSLQATLEGLQTKLKSQYAAIEKEIAGPPAHADFPDSYRIVIRAWQERLASRFGEAAATVEEITKLNPGSDIWRERLETLRLYSQPISSPDQRTVFGDGEVQKRARVIDAPAAVYTEEARAQKTKGDVRLRVVLAADGSVRNVFPIKSLTNGLTESAMEAARQIRFEPAIRNGQPASQFATFVYEFKKTKAEPYIPRTIF